MGNKPGGPAPKVPCLNSCTVSPTCSGPSCLLLPPGFGTWVFQVLKTWERQLSRERSWEQGVVFVVRRPAFPR